MKSNQKIACSVCSCKHYCEGKECDLKEIEVCPKEGCHSGECDESMCSSYENIDE